MRVEDLVVALRELCKTNWRVMVETYDVRMSEGDVECLERGCQELLELLPGLPPLSRLF